jgi:hypothetical protein
MSWCEPHPRRNATAAEVEQNSRKIRALDQNIEAQEDNHDAIHKRIELPEEQANRQSFIAPFYRLPTEILCEIALHCVNGGMKPTDLNQINAAMRSAVNGYKALWASIYFASKLYGHNTKVPDKPFRLLEADGLRSVDSYVAISTHFSCVCIARYRRHCQSR